MWHVWEIRDIRMSFWWGRLKNETAWRITLKWALEIAGWAPGLPASGAHPASYTTGTGSLVRE